MLILKSKFFFQILLFLLVCSAFVSKSTPTWAGDGSINGCQIRRDFSSSTCGNPGYTVIPMGGGGSKQFIFNAAPGSSGYCQIQCGGNGKITSGSGTIGGSVVAGSTWTYNFSTGSDGGRNTNFEITATIEITPPVSPLPSPSPSVVMSNSPSANPSPQSSPSLLVSPNTSASPNTTPSDFSQNLPQSGCSMFLPYIRVSWQPSLGANYYLVYYYNSESGTISQAINAGASNFLDVWESNGLISSHKYSFLVRAVNNQGQYIDSDSATWSHYKFGTFSEMRSDCRKPQTFNLNEPQSTCLAEKLPKLNLSWTESENATKYTVFYGKQGESAGIQVMQTISAPNKDFQFLAEQNYLQPGSKYGFLIMAENNYGYVFSNNGQWSNTLFDWTEFPDCQPPEINLWLNEHPYYELPLIVTTNDAVNIRWAVSNAVSCNASSNPQISIWNQAKNHISGTQPLNSFDIGKYSFTLTCKNKFDMINSNAIDLIVNSPYQPYIQTTQGDVHSNENITVPQ